MKSNGMYLEEVQLTNGLTVVIQNIMRHRLIIQLNYKLNKLNCGAHNGNFYHFLVRLSHLLQRSVYLFKISLHYTSVF